jgi:hypothetical protein
MFDIVDIIPDNSVVPGFAFGFAAASPAPVPGVLVLFLEINATWASFASASTWAGRS